VERGLRFYIFVILLLVISLSYIINAIESGAIDISNSYPNNSYVSMISGDFFRVYCNFPTDGDSFDIELFINDTRYGITNIPGGPTPSSINPNRSIAEGSNYSWYVTCSNSTNWNATNYTQMRYFTVDSNPPLADYVGFWSSGSLSPNNNTFQSSSDVVFNVSFTEIHFSNATYNLLNASSRTVLHTINISSSSEVQANFTSLDEGTYNFFVNVTDLASNKNSPVEWKTVNIDLNSPVVINIGVNNTVTSNTTIDLICNTTDTMDLSNVSVFTDFNGTWLLNETVNISGFSNSTIFTFNNVTEGVHFWTCNASDNVYSTQNFSNYTITVDITSPSASITLGSTSITTAQTVSISCSGSDAIDTSVDIVLSIMKPGESSYSSISVGTYSDVSTTGAYSVQCVATDDASNIDTTTSTFTVTAAPSESSSGGGGGNGGSSSVSVSVNDIINNETKVSTIEKNLRRSASLDNNLESYSDWVENNFIELSSLVGGEFYTFSTTTDAEIHRLSIIHVDSINGFVVVGVQSELQIFTLSSSESTNELDLNDDGREDLRFTLLDFVDRKAVISIEKMDGLFRAPVEEVSIWVWILTILVTLGVSVGFVYLLMKK